MTVCVRKPSTPTIFVSVLLLFLTSVVSSAQGTSFTYQGKLTDAGSPANGNYDMQFKLFDTPTVGTGVPQGSTLTNPTVAVSSGIFSVTLDFGASVFTSAARYLEIGVRPAGNVNPYTVLSPRQLITSSPYAIQTIKATSADTLSVSCVACVQDAQINSVAGSKVNGLIPVNSVPSSSGNYIQNTSSPQAGASFNISGNGTLGALNANGAFSLGGMAAPAVAPAGQGRIYFDSASNKLRVSENGGSFLNLIGAGGVSGSGTTNTIPLWSAGTTLGSSALAQLGSNIGIGNTSPQSKLHIISGTSDLPPRLQSAGTSSFGAGWDFYHGATGKGYVGVPDPSAGFGAGELLLFGGPGTKTSLWANSNRTMTLDTGGNVGIGTATPTSKMEIVAQDGLKITGFQPFLTLKDTNGGNKSSFMQGINGDVFLKTNSTAALVVKDITGSVGIGTTTPSAHLQVAGAGSNGFALGVDGDATQSINGGGFVKAGLLVNRDGSVNLCFNSQASGSCGITVTHDPSVTPGVYDINFPFQINSRFISVTLALQPAFPFFADFGSFIQARPISTQTIRVRTFALAGTAFDSGFYLSVF